MYIRQRRLNLSALLLVSALLLLTACGTMQVDAEYAPVQDDQPSVELVQDEPTEIPTEQVPSMDVHTPEVQQYNETSGKTVDPLLEFEALLMQAVETHNFDLMQSLMGDPFGLAGWGSEGWAYTPDEAIEQFRVHYLGADNTIRFQDAPDLSQQLNGRDILSVCDPAVNPVSALFSVGWGNDGQTEAFLIIAQRRDGTFYWEGILIALSGFVDSAVTQPVIEPSVTLSPLSGPSGTLVQVVASGFPPNMPVTVWIGPENSEFSEAAHSTTDANGISITQVPAQGGPGTNLVFAVSVEDQPGVSSPDLFQITQADSSITLSPSSGPSGTMVQVIASGLPSNTPVTIWMGLENSSFQEAARGTTSANGLFSAQIPVQGTPGTNFTFAVGVDGQTGVASSTTFQVTDVSGTQPPPANVPVLETDVKYVMAFPDVLPMYGGPGDTYPQVGGIFGGMMGTVTGVSTDGQWWRVMCPDDTVGSCWVSADPNVTAPTTLPGF